MCYVLYVVLYLGITVKPVSGVRKILVVYQFVYRAESVRGTVVEIFFFNFVLSRLF